jgi:F-type H+-transporting ATPase subunit b
VLGIAWVLLLVASPALAAGGGEADAGSGWLVLGLQILNTAVLLLVLVRLARRPIKSFLLQRSHTIRRDIETAESRLREAEAEIEGLRQRLARFEDEARAIIARSAEQGEAERQRRLERATESAARIQSDTRTLADQEVARARDELRREVAELATSLASALLQTEIRPEDDRRLVSEYAEQIGAES